MPHFLLTNDDGIDAPGLAALKRAVHTLPGATFTVVAPATEQSQCGHRVTTHEPLHVETRANHHHAVHGTPADCVRIALFALQVKPDFVLSGVNQGGNLGQDIVISGTVAAAREATYHSVPAISLSHYIKRELPLDWDRAAAWIAEILAIELRCPPTPGHFVNFNLPHLSAAEAATRPDIIDAAPATSPIPVAFAPIISSPPAYEYCGSYANRPRDPHSDVAICFGGRISRSVLRL